MTRQQYDNEIREWMSKGCPATEIHTLVFNVWDKQSRNAQIAVMNARAYLAEVDMSENSYLYNPTRYLQVTFENAVYK